MDRIRDQFAVSDTTHCHSGVIKFSVPAKDINAVLTILSTNRGMELTLGLGL
ncbi:MAG: hypothetical protein GXP15_12145 [Gammaproteobacteria bacterium]|nr:hypothetical protein [Gammaproteobacteria bacterium]